MARQIFLAFCGRLLRQACAVSLIFSSIAPAPRLFAQARAPFRCEAVVPPVLLSNRHARLPPGLWRRWSPWMRASRDYARGTWRRSLSVRVQLSYGALVTGAFWLMMEGIRTPLIGHGRLSYAAFFPSFLVVRTALSEIFRAARSRPRETIDEPRALLTHAFLSVVTLTCAATATITLAWPRIAAECLDFYAFDHHEVWTTVLLIYGMSLLISAFRTWHEGHFWKRPRRTAARKISQWLFGTAAFLGTVGVSASLAHFWLQPDDLFYKIECAKRNPYAGIASFGLAILWNHLSKRQGVALRIGVPTPSFLRRRALLARAA